MKLNELDKFINETIYNEVKNTILTESEGEKVVYHIMCDGEPLATFDTMEEAKEALPKYKKTVKNNKELIIEKGVYESHSDMLEKLDNMGEKLEKNMENINEGLTEKGVNKVQQWCDEIGCRETGIKLIDLALNKMVGLSSSDLADTTTFANGLDEIEANLEDGDYQRAWNMAIDTAKEMLTDEGMDTMDMDEEKCDECYQKTEEGMMDPELSNNPNELNEKGMKDYETIYNKLKSGEGDEELQEDKTMCSECGGMLNEEGMCNECGYGKMEESELCSECGGMLNEEGVCNECGMGLGMAEGKMCSECGGMLNEEGMCNECGMMKESKKRTIKLTESKLVQLITKMVNEAMKGDPGTPGIPGVFNTKKAQGGSKKENDDNIKNVEKKMKDYLSFDGNSNSEFPHQNTGDVMAIHNTEEQDAEVAKNLAGLQNLDYDIEPSEKFKERLKMAIEGDSKMGNGPTTGKSTIEPSNGADKGVDAKEEIGNVINSKKAIKKINKQIKDRAEDKKNRVLYNKEIVPVKSETVNESKDNTGVVLNEELERIKNLSSYNKKTQ